MDGDKLTEFRDVVKKLDAALEKKDKILEDRPFLEGDVCKWLVQVLNCV